MRVLSNGSVLRVQYDLKNPNIDQLRQLSILLKSVSLNDTGCWIWRGDSTRGYGRMQIVGSRKKVFCHRFMYALVKGDIPNGYVIDHLCSNPPCCNPNHLESVTQGENVRRAYQRICREG